MSTKLKDKTNDIFLEEYILSLKARNKNKITKAFNYAHDDEWYTTKEDIQYFINNAKIPKDKIIWCPFDLDDSNFVTVFRSNGYIVENSHLRYNQDFYFYEPKKWDIIISNPPFRNKHKLLERLKTLNKPWALIFGIQALNSEKFCYELNKFRHITYIHLQRRMCFTKDHLNYDIKNLKRPSFASMWIANDLFKKQILVWYGVNYKNDKKEFC